MAECFTHSLSGILPESLERVNFGQLTIHKSPLRRNQSIISIVFSGKGRQNDTAAGWAAAPDVTCVWRSTFCPTVGTGREEVATLA